MTCKNATVKLPIPSLFGQTPVYVNHKQYQRILIRRLKKQLHMQKLTEAQIKAVTEVSESIGITSCQNHKGDELKVRFIVATILEVQI